MSRSCVYLGREDRLDNLALAWLTVVSRPTRRSGGRGGGCPSASCEHVSFVEISQHIGYVIHVIHVAFKMRSTRILGARRRRRPDGDAKKIRSTTCRTIRRLLVP